MGLVKIALKKPRVNKQYRSSNRKKVAENENSPMTADSPDDFDFSEVGCELGLVDHQICNIPYDLYDLPDLREVLSLDSWNSILTEEERFSLSAFLPDMDEETFCLTMKELLGGTNLYFGNPVDTFFKRLQGGFYPPNVAMFREGLHFLHSRKYYHSLKSYHDNMRKTIIEMRMVWDQCDRKAGIEERIDIWKMKRKFKSNYLLDLNTVPVDGYENVKSDTLMYPLSKKMKSRNSTRPSNIFSDGIKFSASNSRAKGVLKLKSSKNASFEKLSNNLLDKHQSIMQSPPLNSHIFQDRKFFPLPASLYFGGVGSHCELPFLRQNVVNMNPSFHEFNNLGKYKSFSSVMGGRPFAEPESAVNSMFARQYNSGLQTIERKHSEAIKEEPIIVYKSTPASVSKTSGNFIGKQKMLMGSSSHQMNGQIVANRKPENHFAKPSFSEVFRDERVPLTYKRRKTQTKLNPFDFGKPLNTGIDLNSESPKDLNHRSGESTKALKIKFTVWEDTPTKEDH